MQVRSLAPPATCEHSEQKTVFGSFFGQKNKDHPRKQDAATPEGDAQQERKEKKKRMETPPYGEHLHYLHVIDRSVGLSAPGLHGDGKTLGRNIQPSPHPPAAKCPFCAQDAPLCPVYPKCNSITYFPLRPFLAFVCPLPRTACTRFCAG